MAAVSSPYGLKPLQTLTPSYQTGGFREIVMTTNSADGIYYGDLVNITGGQPRRITATPTTTLGAATPVGVFVGCSYIDPVLRQWQNANFLPPNAITNGYTQVIVRVIDDPDALFVVQAAGPITRASLGLNCALANLSGGTSFNATTGNSRVQMGTTPAITATLAVRIVDFVESTTSTAGDAFTDVIVKFNQGVHAYQQATGQ